MSAARRAPIAELVEGLGGASSPPRSNGELTFEAPWESRAFGLAAALCLAGAYEWEEFRQRLMASIGAWERGEDAEEPWHYYRRWLASLEQLAVEKGLVRASDLDALAAEIKERPKEADHDHDHGHDHAHDG